MFRKCFVLFVALFLAAFITGMGKRPHAQDMVPRMPKEELKARLDAPDMVIIDVRAANDWDGSDRKIAGAVREDPVLPKQWAGKYPTEKTMILYCG